MIARGAACVLLLASLAMLCIIPSDSVVVERQINLSSIFVPVLRNFDPRPRHADSVVEEKSEERPAAVSLSQPLITYYAYNEYQTYPKPIDVVSGLLNEVPIGTCREEVKRASDIYGLSYPEMMAFAIIESSCQSAQRTGSYIGLFQLSQYEFRRYGRTGGDVYNMRDNAMAAAQKFVIEAINFEHAVKRYPTPFDRYCIHQQGSEGCIQHQMQPERVAWESMCATQEGKTKGEKWCRLAIWGNVPSNLKASIKGGVKALTSGEFLDIWRGRVAHFSKIMTGFGEARAETAVSPAIALMADRPAAEKPQDADKPVAKKTKAAEKKSAKKTKTAEKKSAKKTKVADKKSAKNAKVADKKPAKVAAKTAAKTPAKKTRVAETKR